jgi:hypothetical protein
MVSNGVNISTPILYPGRTDDAAWFKANRSLVEHRAEVVFKQPIKTAGGW